MRLETCTPGKKTAELSFRISWCPPVHAKDHEKDRTCVFYQPLCVSWLFVLVCVYVCVWGGAPPKGGGQEGCSDLAVS